MWVKEFPSNLTVIDILLNETNLLSQAIYLDLEKKFNQGFENTALAGIKTFYENHGYIYAKNSVSRKR